jgi:hypothetical protein
MLEAVRLYEEGQLQEVNPEKVMITAWSNWFFITLVG